MKCPCCGSESKAIKHFFKCSNCGHLHRNHPNNFEFQKKFHLVKTRSGNEVSNNKINWDIFHKNRQWIVKARMDKVKDILKEDYTCFDIGAGGGTFANILNTKVAKVECLEIADFLSAEIMRLGFRTFTNDFLEQEFDKTYDVVFAWHVLEHVADIDAFVEKAKSIAKKHLVIEIPSERALPANYDGHLHMFNAKSLAKHLDKNFRTYSIQQGVQKPALLAIIDL